MELIIDSKKYGKRIVYINEEDHCLISCHKWRLLHQANNNTEYAITNIKQSGKIFTLRMHVLIAGRVSGKNIDHIDGNGLNNKRLNLRHVTQQQNLCNKAIGKHNTTGYKGVFLVKSKYNSSRNYWAYIWSKGKRIAGGMFATAAEAALKYNELAIKHHGEFARLNVITHE